MRPKVYIFSVLFVLQGVAIADTVELSTGATIDGTVIGIRDGKLSMREGAGGADRRVDFSEVKAIGLVEFPKMMAAEAARSSDAKTSAALYKQVVAAINNPGLKLLAQMRAIEPTDVDGRWVEAVGLFLEVYQAQPVEAVWKAHPTHVQGAG